MNFDDLKDAAANCDPVDFVKSYLEEPAPTDTDDAQAARALERELKLLVGRVDAARKLSGKSAVELSPHVEELARQMDVRRDLERLVGEPALDADAGEA